MKAYISKSLLVLLAAYVAISSLYIHDNLQRATHFLEQKHLRTNEVNAEMASRALDFFFQNLKASLNVYIRAHRKELVNFSQNATDENQYEAILASIKRSFPAVRSFTLAKADGSPIYENIDGLVNGVCLTDIKRFSRNHNGDIMRLHANPLFYHIDVMLPWSYKVNGTSQQGVFFVNYPAKFVTDILNRFRTQGVRLMLVQKGDPLRIDFTDKGARNSYNRQWRLTQTQFDALKFSVQQPLKHSKWILVAYTADQMLKTEKAFFNKQMIRDIAEAILVGLVLFAALIFLHHKGYRKQQVLEELAHNDALTGLPNRTQFIFRLKQSMLIAERERCKLAVLFVDLDDFKPVNDKYGHHTGDLLLKEVAKRLLKGRRHSDIVARFGGDEFLIALNDIGCGDVLDSIIENIKQEIAKPIEINGVTHYVGASIGRAVFDDDAANLEELIGLADEQMYKIKEKSKSITRD